MSNSYERINRPVDVQLDTSIHGYWQLTATSRRGVRRDITSFRGAPTQVGPWTTSDPFGDKQLTILLPQITVFDAIGYGDLDWVAKGSAIDLIYHGGLPSAYQYGEPLLYTVHDQAIFNAWSPGYRWQGYVVTADADSQAGTTITVVGALYQVDNYQAKPEYPTRPIPYEHAIAHQFQQRPHLRLKPMRVAWPVDWPKTYTPPPKSTAKYLVPAHVKPGDKWSALLTRETGKWEPALTSYIQTLLSSMYTATGRWTLDIMPGRRPTMMHRTIELIPSNHTLVIDPVTPGNTYQLTIDWSQTLDVVYAQGTSLSGVTYTGMEVSSDGTRTYYEPAAYRRQAYPIEKNAWLDITDMPTEIMLQMQAGLDEIGAQQVAADHLRRFADPGVTGTITLAADPTIGGEIVPRYLVRAGMTICILGLLGRPEGVTFHITDTSVDPVAGTNTLTVDSKFRDALTVKEVKLRGRDAMQIPRLLVAGQYTPPVPDQLIPWNYAKGSGFIPSGKVRNCVPLFQDIPPNLEFPYESWTMAHPPSDKKWKDCYIKIAQVPKHRANGSDPNTNVFWSGRAGPLKLAAIPVFIAQVATIRLLQIAAYYSDGSVARVPFHVSFFYSNTASYNSEPRIIKADSDAGQSGGYSYRNLEHLDQNYPFAASSFEQYNIDGSLVDPVNPQTTTTAGLIRAYGTYYQKAGFWPGDDPGVSSDTGATGMLVDESTWQINPSTFANPTGSVATFAPYSKKGQQPKLAGYIYVMFYCDEGTDDVYFMGRMFRVEPGTGSE